MNLLCFLKHLLERRIARRREARRSDRPSGGHARDPPPKTGANHPSQDVHGSVLCRLFGCGSNTRPQPRGNTVSRNQSFYATPRAADAHAIDDARTNKKE